jgi:predicted DsbA family dithiol-disulfide isomerase
VSAKPSVQIRVWADVACPWCWIGHRRLVRALEMRSDLEAALTWEPYQLDPGLPPEGIEWSRMLEERFDGADRARFLLDHVTELGAREGIRFRFDRMTRAPNTARAHALVLAAREADAEWEVALRLFRAHFEEGADLSDLRVLEALAGEMELPRAEVSRALEGGELLEAVEATREEALGLGAQGLPYFRFGSRASLTGAQPPEVFVRALDQVLREGDAVGSGPGR